MSRNAASRKKRSADVSERMPVTPRPFLAKAAEAVNNPRTMPVLRSSAAMHVVSSPAMNFLHKLVALVTAFVLVFGGYAFFDKQYAQLAFQSLKSGASQVAAGASWVAHSVDDALDIAP